MEKSSLRLYFATQNLHKINEAQAILGSHYELSSLEGLHSAPLREPYATLKENAAAKASYIATRYKVNCFSEDTGLFVEALEGTPGVHTARYAGPDANDKENCRKLLLELGSTQHRAAYFLSVIALMQNNKCFFFEGRCKGSISTALEGSSGFGYDPIFMPEGASRSFAQMTSTEKHRYSHRRRVLEALRLHL